MVKFYDAVRYTLAMGVKDDETPHEYQALANKLLDDVLDKDGDTFEEAVTMVVEIAGVDALMRFYDSVTVVMPMAPECKRAADKFLHSEWYRQVVAGCHEYVDITDSDY